MKMLELIITIVGVFAIAYGVFTTLRAVYEDSKRDFKFGLILSAVGSLILISTACFVVVDAGNVGVMNTFGVVDSNTLQPGLSLKTPFTTVIQMSTRTQKYLDYGSDDVATITALSNDGLETTMGIAVNYHLNSAKAPEIYKQVGENYDSIVMVNPIHSVPRDLISKYDTKTLYSASLEGSTDRAMLERELYNQISQRINELGVEDSITIEQVSIRNIDFVQTYKDSIASKMKMDTEIAQKKLEVQKQEMEAKRVAAEAQGIADKARIEAQGKADAMRIEAQGVADANAKISQISENYLDWYFTQTMKDNPRAIYIPTGSNGLPIFKNVESSTA